MSIYQLYIEANRKKDALAFIDLIHDDFSMIIHAHGVRGGKREFASMVHTMMGRGKNIKIENERCLYENEKTLIEHKIMYFPNGTSEAVLSVWMKKDEKLVSLETGATPLNY